MLDATPHPSGQELASFGLGKLSPAAAEVVARHLETCSSCQQAIAQLPQDPFVYTVRNAQCSTTVGPVVPESDTGLEAGTVSPDASDASVPPELSNHSKFRIVRELGRGGMGVVYMAVHTLMDRPVALKVIHPGLLRHPDALPRFRAEVKAAARLDHPNIVRAHDAEQAGLLHLLVMEFVEGESLAQVVKGRGPIPAAEACRYAQQALLGLQHAFERGMTHRDVKPLNLMLTPTGQVKILDFGLARLRDERACESALTGMGQFMGTPDYVAPEQANDARNADTRADVYSLGCTLFFLLTGRPPFVEDSIVKLIRAHAEKEPPALLDLVPGAPSGLSAVMSKMLAKDPSQRYQTPLGAAHALEPYIAGDNSSPRPVRRRQRWVVAALGFLAASALAGVIIVIRDRTGKEVGRVEVPDDYEVVIQPKPDAKETKGASDPKATKGPPAAPASSLDLLNASSIPPEERFSWQPPELAAIIGHHRGRHWREVRSAAFRPDGKQVASGGLDQVIRVWDGDTLREQTFLKGHSGFVNSVAYSPDGKTLASASDDGTVRLWDMTVPKELAVLKGHKGPVRSVAFAPDQKTLASGGWEDQTVLLWDLSNLSSKPRSGLAHRARVMAVAISDDGNTLAVGLADRTVQLWKLTAGGAERGTLLTGARNQVNSVAFAPGGKLLAAGSQDGDVRVYNVSLEEPKQVALLKGHIEGFKDGWTSGVLCVQFSRDGKLLASGGSEDHTVRLWTVHDGSVVETPAVIVHGHGTAVSGVSFGPDGKTLVTCGGDYPNVYDPSVRLWDLSGNVAKERNPIEDPMVRIRSVNFSPDGKWLAAGCLSGSVRLWGLGEQTPKKASVLRDAIDLFEIFCVTFSPDSRRLAAGNSWNPNLRLWDLAANPKKPTFLDGHAAGVHSIAFAPSGKYFVTGGWDRIVRVWDLAGPEPELSARFPGHDNAIWSVAHAPWGKLIASGGWDEAVRLWDLEAADPKKPQKLEGHVRGALAVAFAPKGKLLAAGCGDGSIRIWDLAGQKPEKCAVLNAHTDAITSLAYTPDGKTLASVGHDGRLILWDAATGKMLLDRSLPGPVFGVAFAPDGRHLAIGNGNGTLYILRPTLERP